MAARTIPQRELRNNVAGILRQAEAGTEFTITVRGRPVARLGPVETDTRQVNVSAETLRARFTETPVDAEFATDVARLRKREAPAEDPWPSQ